MTTQPEPGPSLPSLLRHARRQYGDAMRAALAQEGYDDIPANGLYILGGLALSKTGVPISRLVKDLAISKQAAGQLVDTLVARGYLARTPDAADRRQVIVTLTLRGRAAAQTQTIARQAIDAALLDRVGRADLDCTRRTLGALIEIRRASMPEDQKDERRPIISEAMTFEDRRLDDTTFRHCAMSRTLFDDVRLADARFTNIDLQRAKFRDVNLSGVSIEDARITGLTIMGYDISALIEQHIARGATVPPASA